MSDEIDKFRQLADSPIIEMAEMRQMVQQALSTLNLVAAEWRASNNDLRSQLASLVRTAVRDEMQDVREAMELERRLTEERFKTLDAEVRANIELNNKRLDQHEGRIECHDIDISGRPTRDEFQKLVTSTARELHDFEMQVDELDDRVKKIERAPGEKALKTMAAIGGVITTGTIVGFGPQIVAWISGLFKK